MATALLLEVAAAPLGTMSDPEPKRIRTTSGLIPLRSSFRNTAKILAWAKQEGVEPSATEKGTFDSLRRKMSKFVSTRTPYGCMIESCPSPWGMVDSWNPSVALWYLCEHTPQFGDFLQDLLADTPHQKLKVILNTDGFKVGCVLRPDKGRTLEGVYWTFLQYPDWMKACDLGWIPLAYIPERQHKDSEASRGWTLKFACTRMYGAEGKPNMADLGVLCRTSTGQVHVRVEKDMHFLPDEIGLQYALSLKGANGKKPCMKCKNIMGRTSVDSLCHHRYLCHFATARVEQFDLHTDESVWAMADSLAIAKTTTSAGDFDNLEKAYGLKYTEDGFLFDRQVRKHMKPITGVLYDWMHCLVTSGGLAQFEINMYVRECESLGYTIGEIDQFLETIFVDKASKKVRVSNKYLKQYANYMKTI